MPGDLEIGVVAKQMQSSDAGRSVEASGLEVKLQGLLIASFRELLVDFSHRTALCSSLSAASPPSTPRSSLHRLASSYVGQPPLQKAWPCGSERSGAQPWLAGLGEPVAGIGMASTSPVLCIQLRAIEPLLRLPDQLHLGACIRDIEVASRAVGSWTKSLRVKDLPSKSHVQGVRQPRTVELSIVVDKGLCVEAQAPPREAWLACRAPLLASTAAHRLLESESVSVDPGSPAPGPRTPAALPDVASRFNTAAFKMLCDEVDAKDPHQRPGSSAIRISLGRLELSALFCPCKDGNRAERAALEFMTDIDPPSKGVLQAQCRLFHVDLSLSNLAVGFGALKDPLLGASELSVFGSIVMARPASARPEQSSVVVPLCRRLGCMQQLAVTAKRCRPPWKLYTRLDAKVGAIVVEDCSQKH